MSKCLRAKGINFALHNQRDHRAYRQTNAADAPLREERLAMMAKSHVVVGLVTWVAVAPALHVVAIDPWYLALAVIGSLLPDIDHPKSWVGRQTRPVSTAIAAVLGHRGITHSAIAVAGLVAVLLHAGYHRGAVIALAVGYFSHLAADLLTPQGLRLAWPLRGTWALPLCRTGSFMEGVVVLALVCLGGWWSFIHSGQVARLSGWFPQGLR